MGVILHYLSQINMYIFSFTYAWRQDIVPINSYYILSHYRKHAKKKTTLKHKKQSTWLGDQDTPNIHQSQAGTPDPPFRTPNHSHPSRPAPRRLLMLAHVKGKYCSQHPHPEHRHYSCMQDRNKPCLYLASLMRPSSFSSIMTKITVTGETQFYLNRGGVYFNISAPCNKRRCWKI